MFNFFKLMVDKENGGSTVLSMFTHIKQVHVLEQMLFGLNEKEDLIWYYNSDTAGAICRNLNIKESYLKKILKDMKRLNILYTKSRGVYIIPKKYLQVKKYRDENQENN